MLMISLFVTLLFSCENKQYINTYSSRIDSLAFVLDEYRSSLKTIDTSRISQELHLIRQFLANNERSGNINSKDTVHLIQSVEKSFEEFLVAYPSLNNELEYGKLQLNSFRHDLNKSFLSEEQTALFFEQEKQSVQVLHLKITYYQKLVKINTQKLKRIKTGLDQLNDRDIH